MEQPPPLSPEEVSRHAESEYALLGQPQAVKVFGILHVIFASIGIISVVWATVASFAGNAFLAFGSRSAAVQAQMQAQAEMQEQLLPATVISTFLTAVIAALMLYAGILLLKKRRNALKWSNRYAWTSLAGKAVNLVMFFIFTVPATKEMMHAAGGTSGAPAMQYLDIFMLISGMVGILISCIYPVLTLILLNRPKTKAWFANQPL